MKYDENSFLTGISVGRALKGWALGPSDSTVDDDIRVVTGHITNHIKGFTIGPVKFTGRSDTGGAT